MKRLFFALAAACLIGASASAQTPADDDLAASFRACRQHLITRPFKSEFSLTAQGEKSSLPGGWEPGWEQCELIQAAYQKSAAAASERERAAQVEADRQRMLGLAKKLQ